MLNKYSIFVRNISHIHKTKKTSFSLMISAIFSYVCVCRCPRRQGGIRWALELELQVVVSYLIQVLDI